MRQSVVKIGDGYYLEKYSGDGREVIERYPIEKNSRCPEGYHWVKGHDRKEKYGLSKVDGYCARNPDVRKTGNVGEYRVRKGFRDIDGTYYRTGRVVGGLFKDSHVRELEKEGKIEEIPSGRR
jgi:hypothetical protein